MLYSKYPGSFIFAIAVSFFLLSFFSPISYSQTRDDDAPPVFILKGNTKFLSGKPAEGVDLELKKNGQTILKTLTGKNGKYEIKMEVSVDDKNHNYLLYITQPGTVPKSISLNTYIAPEEASFLRYVFELEIKMIETKEKDIIIEKPSGRIHWDTEQHDFAFDQTYLVMKEDDTERLLAEKRKREEEELAKQKAEEARLKAEADAKLLADQQSQAEAERIIQENLAAMKKQMREKRMQDSLDSVATAGKAIVEIIKISKPISPDDVDENAFDGTGAYSINIAKKALKQSQEKMNLEKATNLSAKYETNNTLTSLLNMVDEHDKSQKLKVKSTQQ